jgi:DNA invertase Pin-like site-specific DNA recombinase
MTDNRVAVYFRFGSETAGFCLPDDKEIFKAYMKSDEKTKAWIYCRSATGEGEALQKQHEAALRYAIDHNLTVIGVSSDIGNGLKYDHAGLMAMLSAVKSGLVSALIIRDISRIGRNALKTQNIIEKEILPYGVKLLCYSD